MTVAAEARDAAWVGPFLRGLGCDEATAGAAAELLAAGAGVLASGWRRREGVLLLGPPGPERPALVAAATERALRDLLLALPRGERLRLRTGHDWHLPVAAGVLDEHGVKRGHPDGGGGTLERRHPVVELLRELARPEGRQRLGMFVAEGPTLVRRAIDDGLPVECVVRRSGAAAERGGWRASDGLMGTLTPTRPLPDVVAAVHLRLRDAAELAPDRAPVVLAAEHLQNPDNLGMVLRTADAAGAGAVVVAGDATDPLHRNCVRAARGAVGRIPIFRSADLPGWIAGARSAGMRVVGATAHGDVDLFEAGLDPPVAIVVGNEEVGVSPRTLAACSDRVAIPMAPGQSSLNVGVAAGVALFEVVRRG
ncbi:MAG TPA: RNA methyltransferase [Candidatus Dormibacteraeota bacterium]|nr:RNA methyltransferase [Candidatus Dormibacteraeota bacterium]